MRKDVASIFFLILFIIIGLFFQRSNNNSSQLTQETTPGKSISNTQETEEGGDIMQFEKAPEMEIDTSKTYTAIVKTNLGDITIELTADKTPITVNNFVFLARNGFYDGVIFHRVIKDFMIQGGDPLGIGTGGPGYQFEDEITNDQVFDKPGILAMANSGPDTNGSQFFITHAPTPWLNGKHTIFGKVTDGMDFLDAIANTEVGPQDKPVDKVIIESIEILEK